MLNADQSALEQAAMPYNRVAEKNGWISTEDGVVILSSLKSKDGKLPTIYIGRGYPLRTRRVIPDSREATFEICTPDVAETVKRSVTALKMEAEAMRKADADGKEQRELSSEAGSPRTLCGSENRAPGAEEGTTNERRSLPVDDRGETKLPDLDI